MTGLSRAPQQWATFARVWYLLDGKMQPPGKLAALASVRLQGLHKPVYHQLSDCGDHVVIMNTRHIAFSGNKWEQKVYSSHTGYPGGFKQVTAAQLHRKDPVAIVKLAIYGMLPKNLHRRTLMQRLHLFPDEDIPEDILKNLTEELPQPRKVPRRLDEYTQEEIEAFPRVWSPNTRETPGFLDALIKGSFLTTSHTGSVNLYEYTLLKLQTEVIGWTGEQVYVPTFPSFQPAQHWLKP